MPENPKLTGSNIVDCVPHEHFDCPNGCRECFFMRPGAFYTQELPYLPDPAEVGERIVRVNSGHDSNCDREMVIERTAQYPRRFFNTSIPRFNFPDPFVLTANPDEESDALIPPDIGYHIPDGLMFVRLRVSPGRLDEIRDEASEWASCRVPVVLTYMRYYTHRPDLSIASQILRLPEDECYVWKKSTLNDYWCPTPEYLRRATEFLRGGNCRISMCGTPESGYCRECRNCENYYWQAVERMGGA